MPRATVLGAGSWGTAFAKVLADAGSDVTIWSRRGAVAAEINGDRRNSGYLPGVTLPAGLTATADAGAALDGTELVAIAVPSQTLRDNLAAWRSEIPADVTLVSLMKGVELGTTKRMTEVITESLDTDPRRVGVLSGPNLAKEIGAEQPTATVVACPDEQRARRVQDLCHTLYFRPYVRTDVVGCEFGGAVKNIIALAVGMAAGMGYGHNTLASLITRGLAETARLGERLGADPLTFSGLAGMGDLVATCSSPQSRNRTFGERLGRGATLVEAERLNGGQVVEGVKSSRAVLALARQHDVDMPITEAVDAICGRGTAPAPTLATLMTRSMKAEA